MTPKELTDKLTEMVNEGSKLINQINDEGDAKKVKDYVATLAYYAGLVTGTMEKDAKEARIYRGLRKHMYVGSGSENHPSWVWPELKIIPWTSFTLDKMLEQIGRHEGEDLSVFDRDQL